MDQSYFSKTCDKIKLEIKEVDKLIEEAKLQEAKLQEAKLQKEKNFFDLRPQCASIDSGPEPSITMLLEDYYREYFPEDYKKMAKDYLDKLMEMKNAEQVSL
ncbi:TPA: hypothetical protein MA058_003404 [Klebsiella pneumoniae]|nr:hypothetical protein [Klebsiella pneumoniae]